jgi:octopine/nopaline transport system substrate-binding protein
MKMKKLTIVAALAAAMLAGPAMAKEYKSITIATEGAYAPWNFKDSAGNLKGFELDLAADLCKRMALKCTVIEQAWDGIIPSLKAGKYDVIMAGMSITEKRKKIITFSHAYAATPARFVVLKSSKSAGFKGSMAAVNLMEVDSAEKAALDSVVKEFKGKTIGVQTATTHENFLKEYLGNDVSIKTYDTQENLDLDLQAGRVDAALASMSYWAPLLKSDKGKDMVAVGPDMTGGPFGAGVGAGIRKEDQKLADMFSKAITEAIADGTVSKMAIQWFGFDASVK